MNYDLYRFIIILFANNISKKNKNNITLKNTLVHRLGICRKWCHVGGFDFNDTASENFQKNTTTTTKPTHEHPRKRENDETNKTNIKITNNRQEGDCIINVISHNSNFWILTTLNFHIHNHPLERRWNLSWKYRKK